MNNERLAELKERAEKATQIAADIAALKLAQDGAMRLLVRHWNTGDEPLDDKLSRDVLVAGLAAVLSQKEIELEMMLNGGAYLAEPIPQRRFKAPETSSVNPPDPSRL